MDRVGQDQQRVHLVPRANAHQVLVERPVARDRRQRVERIGLHLHPVGALHHRAVAVEEEAPVLERAPEQRRRRPARRLHPHVGEPLVAELVGEHVLGDEVGEPRHLRARIVGILLQAVHREHGLHPRRQPQVRIVCERLEPEPLHVVADGPCRCERRRRAEPLAEPCREPQRDLIVVVAVRAVERARGGGHVEVRVAVLVCEEERAVVFEDGDLADVSGVGRRLRAGGLERGALGERRVRLGHRVQVGPAGEIQRRPFGSFPRPLPSAPQQKGFAPRRGDRPGRRVAGGRPVRGSAAAGRPGGRQSGSGGSSRPGSGEHAEKRACAEEDGDAGVVSRAGGTPLRSRDGGEHRQ